MNFCISSLIRANKTRSKNMDDVKLLTTLKVLIIGESNVGKSRFVCNLLLLNQFIITLIALIEMLFIHSLLLRFIDDEFDPEQSLTIGVDFKTKIVNIDDNHVKLGKMNHFNRIQCFLLNICLFHSSFMGYRGSRKISYVDT